MALNFPDSPTLNQVYTDSTSGFSYQWDGTVWQSYSDAATDNISTVDDISSLFDGVTDTFALAVGGDSISPASQQMRVVLGGIVQEPGSDYTTSGSNIIFSTPPSGGLNCSIVSLGRAIPLTVAVLNDGSVTPVKLSTGGPSWNTGGDLSVSGDVTATTLTSTNTALLGGNKVKVGVGTTSLIVEGDARITGILTIGTSSVTIDGVNNQISIGTLNITESGISGGTPNITVGVITASSVEISNDATIGTVVVGSAVTVNSTGIDVVGVVTATSFVGDGSNLTGVGGAAAVTVLTEDTTLSSGTAYMLNTSGLVLTLPATPSTGDAVDILNNVSGIHTLARNGSTIMSLSEDMTFGEQGLKFKVWYTGSTWSLF